MRVECHVNLCSPIPTIRPRTEGLESSNISQRIHLAPRECHNAGKVGYGELLVEAMVHREFASAECFNALRSGHQSCNAKWYVDWFYMEGVWELTRATDVVADVVGASVELPKDAIFFRHG